MRRCQGARSVWTRSARLPLIEGGAAGAAHKECACVVLEELLLEAWSISVLDHRRSCNVGCLLY